MDCRGDPTTPTADTWKSVLYPARWAYARSSSRPSWSTSSMIIEYGQKGSVVVTGPLRPPGDPMNTATNGGLLPLGARITSEIPSPLTSPTAGWNTYDVAHNVTGAPKEPAPLLKRAET